MAFQNTRVVLAECVAESFDRKVVVRQLAKQRTGPVPADLRWHQRDHKGTGGPITLMPDDSLC